MSEPVYGGVLSGFLNWLGKSFSKPMKSSMDSLIKIGMEVRDAKKTEEGGFLFEAVGNKHTVKVKCIPLPEREGRFDVFIKNQAEKDVPDGNGGTKDVKAQMKEYHDITPENFDDCISKFFKEIFNEDMEAGWKTARAEGKHRNEDANFDVDPQEEADSQESEGSQQSQDNQDVAESKHLKLKMKTIKGSKGVKHRLTGVFANYDFAEAADDIATLVSDPDFTDQLDTGESYWSVAVDQGGYLVDPTAEFNTDDCALEVLKAAYVAWNNIVYLATNVTGTDFISISSALKDLQYTLQSQIESITTALLITQMNLPDPYTLIGSCTPIGPGPIDGLDASRYAADTVRVYMNTLKTYGCNLPTICRDIEDWVRYLSIVADYTLSRVTG